MSDLTEAYEYYKKAWERQLAEETSKLKAENARLREALQFYAKLGDDIYPNTTIIHDEWGKKAREALKGDV